MLDEIPAGERLRRIVAVHEAGHAVVALRHRLPFRYVTVTPRPGKSEGHVQRVRPRGASGFHCHHIMPVYAAGPLAQDIFTGCRDRIVATDAGRGDFPEIRDCARLVRKAQRRGEDTGMVLPANATVRKIAEVAWQDAYRIVTAEWGAVLAVAVALLSTSRAVSQAECRRIVAAADRVDPPACASQAERFWPSWFMPGWWVPEPAQRKVAA